MNKQPFKIEHSLLHKNNLLPRPLPKKFKLLYTSYYICPTSAQRMLTITRFL